ncbi:hypothetical protein Q0F98_21285 [Paenibacillus amylolyticus]|nr:hypothetical protein Q0F98_21285 [Paenibacillus amylolyticus]
MSGIGKMQKVVGGIQQMAPMMKLVMGILPFGKGKSNNSAADADYEEYTPPGNVKANVGTKQRMLHVAAIQLQSAANPIPPSAVPKVAKVKFIQAPPHRRWVP